MWKNIKELEAVLRKNNYIAKETVIDWSELADSFYIVKKTKKKQKKYLDKLDIISADIKIMSTREVARKYNMSTRTVQEIKKGTY